MTKKLQRVRLLLAFGMGASLAIVLVTGGIALILMGQPSGNVVGWVADVFAWTFSLAFFAALVLTMIEQRQRETGGNIRLRSRDVCAVRQIESSSN
jgi:riboflavin transporter FmnP